MRRLLIALALLLATNYVLPTAASAQASPVTFTISPAIVDKKVDPGQNFDVAITIKNSSETAQPLKAYAKNFSAKNIEGEITFGDEDITSYAAATWMSIEPSSILLPPGGQQTVTVHIAVPKNAEPGGHYASVLFEQMLQQVPSQHSQVGVAARLSALFYLTVSGNVVEAGQLLGAKPGDNCTGLVCGFTAPKFLDKGPVPFEFIFTNTGNTHVRPKGTITISQGGKTLATLPVADRAVLPNSQRRFQETWQRLVLFGKYDAKLHLVYGSKNYTIDAATTFYAFPWQIVLAVTLLVGAGLAIFLLRKYYHVKTLHKKAKGA